MLSSNLIYIAFLVVTVAIPVAYAQKADDDSYPPPPRTISKEEKARLVAETDVKRRTKLALEFMEARMKQAEALHSLPDFDAMFVELGAFHALVDDTLEFLTGSSTDSDKVLNNLKRFEIGVRGFVPRLELIRRDLPFRYEFYVRRLAIFLRDAREKAIEPLFSDTVVPTKKP